LLEKFAFMHIPKAAGTSIVTGLLAAGFERPKVGYFDRSLFGGFDRFDTMGEILRPAILLHEPDFRDADLVHGHLFLSTLRASAPHHRVMTVLREPRSRLVSTWLYGRSLSDDFLAPWGDWADVIRRTRGSLSSLISAPTNAAWIDNVATRMLVGPHPLIPLEDFIKRKDDDDLIHEALDALSSIHLVCLYEDPTIAQQIVSFVGRPVVLPTVNNTKAMPGYQEVRFSEELSAATLQLLRERSRLDKVLWDTIAAKMGLSHNNSEDAFLSTILRYTCD
jgi:hypothetical protein